VRRMPKYEKFRNERERAFQKRVLASGSKRNVFFAVINSGFFLWLLSAVLLTIGGGYITNHQQCMREADQLIERRNKISNELSGRQLAFSSALEVVTTLKQLRYGPSTLGSTVPELSKLSYLEVQQEWWKLLNRTEYDELPNTPIRSTRNEWSEFNRREADRGFEEVQRPIDDKPRKLDPNLEFRSRKLYVQLFNGLDSFLQDIERLAYYFEPNCSPMRTLGVALGYKPQIVHARVSPLVETDSFNLLADSIEGFNKLKSEMVSLNNEKKLAK
jgi:hypothetical protein